MKRMVVNAAQDKTAAQEVFEDQISALKDNFDFALEGLNKMGEEVDYKEAASLADNLNAAVEKTISEFSAVFAE